MKKNSGFTLLEVLITTVLIAIVMAIGVPSMSEFIKNDRLATQINTLVGHLALARSTAVSRHQQVIVCASNDQATCSSADWADGWIVFVDVDASGGISVGDELLRAQEALTGNNTLVSTAGTVVTYDNRGFAPASTGSFALCDDRGAPHMKSITISNTGRVRKGGGASCT